MAGRKIGFPLFLVYVVNAVLFFLMSAFSLVGLFTVLGSEPDVRAGQQTALTLFLLLAAVLLNVFLIALIRKRNSPDEIERKKRMNFALLIYPVVMLYFVYVGFLMLSQEPLPEQISAHTQTSAAGLQAFLAFLALLSVSGFLNALIKLVRRQRL